MNKLYSCLPLAAGQDALHKILVESIAEAGKFLLQMALRINKQYEILDQFLSEKDNHLKQSNGHPNNSVNFFLFDLVSCVLIDEKCNPLFTAEDLKAVTQSQFASLPEMVLGEKWLYGFTKSKNTIQLMQRFYSFDKLSELNHIVKACIQRAKQNIETFRESESQGDALMKDFNEKIYEYSLAVLEKEQLHKRVSHQIQEEQTRQAKNAWKKLWKRQRVFNGAWRHASFYLQSDKKFSMEQYGYDVMQASTIFYYKIDKYEMKNRVRPFLKVKLIEPQFDINYSQKIKANKLGLTQIDVKLQEESIKKNNYLLKSNLYKSVEKVTKVIGKTTNIIQKGITSTFKIISTPINLAINKKQAGSQKSNRLKKQQFQNIVN